MLSFAFCPRRYLFIPRSTESCDVIPFLRFASAATDVGLPQLLAPRLASLSLVLFLGCQIDFAPVVDHCCPFSSRTATRRLDHVRFDRAVRVLSTLSGLV